MRAKPLTTFFIGLVCLLTQVGAKHQNCRAKFNRPDNKFQYCTKFGAQQNGKVDVKFRTRLVSQFSDDTDAETGVV